MTETGTDREETLLLRSVRREESSMNMAFRAYLEYYCLSFQEVAWAAQVRLATVWNIDHNIPVSRSHALAVRAALERLTGIPYVGFIAIQPEWERSGQP